MADPPGDLHIAAKFRFSRTGWTEACPDLASDQTTGSPSPSRPVPVFSVHACEDEDPAGSTGETSS